jgi:flagellar assembly protein FliH
MTSSKAAPRQVPPPPNSRAGTSYTRFIPREELQGFASWTPGAFGDRTAAPAARSAEESEPAAAERDAQREAQLRTQVQAARQSGYEDGYRDGLVALDNFKHSIARQLSAQIGQLVASFDREFETIEQQLAAALTRIAVQLARQVVRSELAARPALVAQVAREAVGVVLASALRITVQVHPDDLTLVAEGAGELLAARGARLVAQPAVERGGCIVESDIGSVDARIETRWAQAAQSLAGDLTWERE